MQPYLSEQKDAILKVTYSFTLIQGRFITYNLKHSYMENINW